MRTGVASTGNRHRAGRNGAGSQGPRSARIESGGHSSTRTSASGRTPRTGVLRVIVILRNQITAQPATRSRTSARIKPRTRPISRSSIRCGLRRAHLPPLPRAERLRGHRLPDRAEQASGQPAGPEGRPRHVVTLPDAVARRAPRSARAQAAPAARQRRSTSARPDPRKPAARARGAPDHAHRLRGPQHAAGPVARHRPRRQGRVLRRRPRHQQPGLHPARRQPRVHRLQGLQRRRPERRRPAPPRRSATRARSPRRAGRPTTSRTSSTPRTRCRKGCNITVRGIAPGASLIGMKVFGNANSVVQLGDPPGPRLRPDATTTRTCISESFGGYPIPDTTQDLTRQFNEQAVAAGVTVVESTGDSGVRSSPSSAVERSVGDRGRREHDVPQLRAGRRSTATSSRTAG